MERHHDGINGGAYKCWLMTLKYKGGEVKVLVPPEVLVVNRIVTDRSALKPGAEVSLQGKQNADGAQCKSDHDPAAGRR
jgi:hypothetical protein